MGKELFDQLAKSVKQMKAIDAGSALRPCGGESVSFALIDSGWARGCESETEIRAHSTPRSQISVRL
jgi:hypothetical protein